MFQRGDKVKVRAGQSKGEAKEGKIYTVDELDLSDSEPVISLMEIHGEYYERRFELVAEAGPDPNKPYPDPERDAEMQRRIDLINYKKALRDLLYGTTSIE